MTHYWSLIFKLVWAWRRLGDVKSFLQENTRSIKPPISFFFCSNAPISCLKAQVWICENFFAKAINLVLVYKQLVLSNTQDELDKTRYNLSWNQNTRQYFIKKIWIERFFRLFEYVFPVSVLLGVTLCVTPFKITNYSETFYFTRSSSSRAGVKYFVGNYTITLLGCTHSAWIKH